MPNLHTTGLLSLDGTTLPWQGLLTHKALSLRAVHLNILAIFPSNSGVQSLVLCQERLLESRMGMENETEVEEGQREQE